VPFIRAYYKAPIIVKSKDPTLVTPELPRCSMRRSPDLAWRMCRRTWRSRMWPQGVSRECLRIGARLFRDITSITRAAATPPRHAPCWLMRPTGVSATGSASGDILNEDFLKLVGLTANALTRCRSDRSTTRRLDGGADLRAIGNMAYYSYNDSY
jgi:hypothetical protein